MKKFSILFLFALTLAISGLAQNKKPVKPVTTKKQEPKHTVVNKPTIKPVAPNKKKGPLVELSTEFGIIVLRLYDETPLHRDNFVKLVKSGFYDSLLFHRVIKSFMIQGGDPLSKNADSNAALGSGDVGYKIPAEFNPNLFHKKGALAAARDNNPQQMSSGCQFYIVHGRTFTTTELEQILNSRNMNRKQEILYQVYQSDTVQAAINSIQKLNDKELVRQYMEKLQVVTDKIYQEKYPNAEKVNLDQMQTYVEFGGAPHLDGAYTVFGEIEKGYDVLDKIATSATKPVDRPLKDIRMKMRMLN